MNAQDFSSTEARFVILEMSVAALIAQLPPQSLEEVAGMLDFVAEAADDVNEVAAAAGDGHLDHIRHWASEMLERVMVSRKAPDPNVVSTKSSSSTLQKRRVQQGMNLR